MGLRLKPRSLNRTFYFFFILTQLLYTRLVVGQNSSHEPFFVYLTIDDEKLINLGVNSYYFSKTKNVDERIKERKEAKDDFWWSDLFMTNTPAYLPPQTLGQSQHYPLFNFWAFQLLEDSLCPNNYHIARLSEWEQLIAYQKERSRREYMWTEEMQKRSRLKNPHLDSLLEDLINLESHSFVWSSTGYPSSQFKYEGKPYAKAIPTLDSGTYWEFYSVAKSKPFKHLKFFVKETLFANKGVDYPEIYPVPDPDMSFFDKLFGREPEYPWWGRTKYWPIWSKYVTVGQYGVDTFDLVAESPNAALPCLCIKNSE